MGSMMDFDPMLLESLLHYPETPDETLLVVCAKVNGVQEKACMEIVETGAMETSPLDLGLPLEHGEVSETQSLEEHEPDTLTQPNGNGRIIAQQEQGSSNGGSALNPPIEGWKKRKNWSVPETDLLWEVYISQKTKLKSRLDNEPVWEGIAKLVPQRTATMCRRRMDTLKKSYNAVKKHCDKEKKEFTDLKEADFGKLKLASQITEHWYNQIRDHWSPRPSRKSRDQGAGSSSTLGEVGLLPDGFHSCGGVSTDVVIMSGPPPISQSNAACGVVVEETTWSLGCGVDVIVVWKIRLRTISNGSLGKCRQSGISNSKRPVWVKCLWLIIFRD